MNAAASLSTDELLRYAWEAGALDWKLREYQLPVYQATWDAINDPACDVFSVVISRRFGKTFGLRLIAAEFAKRNPESNVNIGAPVGKEMRKINRTIMRSIFRDCPEDLRPQFNATEGSYAFPNGSMIYTAGLNNGHVDDQRGNDADLNLLDEAGFIDELEYALHDVYAPQTDTSGGTNILSSTPPATPAHDFVKIANDCAERGHFIRRTIHDTTFSEKRKAAIAARCGGEHTTTWRREYLAEFITDSALAIVPEWNEDLYKAEIAKDEFFPFYHLYESMDIGVRDQTAVLFAYYDFRNAKLIVEDEWTEHGHDLTTPKIAQSIREYERKLEFKKLYRRIADNNNLQLLNDLAALHGLPFVATSKDELPAMVNHLRTLVAAGRVIVHPRCVKLLRCLKEGIWENQKLIGREFGRSKELGHYDALAALIYLARNLDVSTNPIPASYGFDPARQHIRDPRTLQQHPSAAVRQLNSIFAPRRPRVN